MILESSRRLKIYESALASGAPTRRAFTADDFVDKDVSSKALEYREEKV